MIVIQAEFLRGCFVAAEPTAVEYPEWPPSPARLFSALVASAYAQGADPSPLVALEAAPEVRFGPALSAPGSINFAPAAFVSPNGGRPNRAIHRPQMVGIDAPVFFAWAVALDPENFSAVGNRAILLPARKSRRFRPICRHTGDSHNK